MKPFTIYHLFHNLFLSVQQSLVNVIVREANPDLIYLLGASISRRRTESIFQQSAPTSHHISSCFLLILMQDLGNKETHDWQDKLENNCKTLLPVTIIVLQQSSFEEWLTNGHPFAANVQEIAPIIYKSEQFCLPDRISTNNEEQLKSLEMFHLEGLRKSKEFLAGSELFRIRKQHAMAAFMLHQSVEQSLRTILKIGTGYHSNTHSIDRLIRYTGLVSYQLPDVFPQQTEADKRLFSLLQKAYIDPRYKEGYQIGNDELLQLTAKAQQIIMITSEVGKQILSSIR
ncbi:HEPN domain-containing protein [Sediminibacterium sp. WSJ-3]|nr:HEPN domain-containing protein [Sediminibacterium soli]